MEHLTPSMCESLMSVHFKGLIDRSCFLYHSERTMIPADGDTVDNTSCCQVNDLCGRPIQSFRCKCLR